MSGYFLFLVNEGSDVSGCWCSAADVAEEASF